MENKEGGARTLSVRGVYLYFKALEDAGTVEAFLADCDAKNLTLGVSDTLYALGHDHFGRIQTESVGPECPACPSPRRL